TADFLAPAAGQKWDRLRLTLSQPFSRHSQFGLSFVRVRTPLDHQQPPRHGPVGVAHASARAGMSRGRGCSVGGLQPGCPRSPRCPLAPQEPADSPCHPSPAFSQTLLPKPCSSSREEEQLKSRLQQLEPGAWSPARLSRPARMVLSAARSRALRARAG
ncbi:TRPC2 protein, partial [Nyctibius bracteatus]|nr:TRPC2 protein [Nyctibius bracteatus]